MENEMRYCYSWDGEDYIGYYATEKEALEVARFEAANEEVYIGVCTEQELRWSSMTETIIERIEENLYDDVGEDAERFYVSAEDEKDLQMRLDNAVKSWIKDRNIRSGCYQVTDAHRVLIGEI